MTGRRGWGLPEQHLALDALVAFVDGELSANARDRAAAHLAGCPACAADAAAQRQARAAVRAAGAPSVSPGLLQALQSIPSNAELPAQPEGLALTEDGQLVTVDPAARRGSFGSGAALGSSTPLGGGQQPLGSSTPLGETGLDSRGRSRPGRGRRTGAGVVFSSLVLGALALVAVPDEQGPPPAVGPLPHPGGAYDSALIPASTGLRTPPPSPAPSLAAVPGAGTSSIPASRPAMSATAQP